MESFLRRLTPNATSNDSEVLLLMGDAAELSENENFFAGRPVGARFFLSFERSLVRGLLLAFVNSSSSSSRLPKLNFRFLMPVTWCDASDTCGVSTQMLFRFFDSETISFGVDKSGVNGVASLKVERQAAAAAETARAAAELFTGPKFEGGDVDGVLGAEIKIMLNFFPCDHYM